MENKLGPGQGRQREPRPDPAAARLVLLNDDGNTAAETPGGYPFRAFRHFYIAPHRFQRPIVAL
jgi:hypothetical protein